MSSFLPNERFFELDCANEKEMLEKLQTLKMILFCGYLIDCDLNYPAKFHKRAFFCPEKNQSE